jgi:hypothetical protein
LPALFSDTAISEGTSQQIVLRRSFAMRVALAAFVVTASCAVYSCMASWLTAWQAVPLTLAVFALLTLSAVRHDRAQPAALRMGREGISVWGRAGNLLVYGRIAGCAHWSDRLLVLEVTPDEGRRQTLLVPADTVPTAVFRELAVRGRRRAGA